MTPAAAYRIFDEELARFDRHFRMGRVDFVILDRPCSSTAKCAFRDLAFAKPGFGSGGRITMLARALKLPAANVRGLIRHELGHLADVDIDQPGREQRADDIAEFVSGRRISYDARDVQTTGRGKYPRPRYLHR